MEKLLKLGRGRGRGRRVDSNCDYSPLPNCDDNDSSGVEEEQEKEVGEEGTLWDCIANDILSIYT